MSHVEIKKTKKYGTLYTLKMSEADMILVLKLLPGISPIRCRLVAELYDSVSLHDLIDGGFHFHTDDEAAIYDAKKEYLSNWLGFEI